MGKRTFYCPLRSFEATNTCYYLPSNFIDAEKSTGTFDGGNNTVFFLSSDSRIKTQTRPVPIRLFMSWRAAFRRLFGPQASLVGRDLKGNEYFESVKLMEGAGEGSSRFTTNGFDRNAFSERRPDAKT